MILLRSGYLRAILPSQNGWFEPFNRRRYVLKGLFKNQSQRSTSHATFGPHQTPWQYLVLSPTLLQNGELRHPVLALKQLKEEHSGENLAQLVIEVVQDYEIPLKLGYFMMDNARNNDTLMVELSICGSNLYYIALNC
jgi:hypothetical protein